jgi:cytochrome P450
MFGDHSVDPYPMLQELHGFGEQTMMPDGYLAVFGYDACNELMRSPSFGRANPDRGSRVMWPIPLSESQRAELRRIEPTNLGLWLQLIDGDEHARQRKLVSRVFSPTNLRQLQPNVERAANQLVEAIPLGESIDLVDRLAYSLPAHVMGELIGLPIGDRDWFAVRARAQRFDRDPTSTFELLREAAQARVDLAAYVRDLIALRRVDPRDDVASALIGATDDGDRLSEPELISLVTMLYIAGYSTTGNLLSNGIRALLDHPVELDRLRADRVMLPRAVEEIIRFDPSVISVDYHAAVDGVFRGESVAAGTEVHVFTGVANRDPAIFSAPEQFIADRSESPPLSFGAGAHHCIGAALARMEVKAALAALLDRFDTWTIDDANPPQIPLFNYRGYESMRMIFS